MSNSHRIQLTQRQRDILRRVVEQHVASGQPVGWKALVEKGGLDVSPSTVRNEFAELERLGLLTHPHTSAGRVPTKAGYRFYADELLDQLEPRPSPFPLDLGAARSEVDAALQATSETLSQVTRLLALVSAPPLQTTTVRHVEVLVLQRQFAEPGLSPREVEFLELIRPAFTDLLGEQEQRLYVGGRATLLGEARADELDAGRRLLEALERRAQILELVGEALGSRRPIVRVGEELDDPALRDAALVGASYGLMNRRLGAVSLLGPVRMDYETAIRSVRAAAHELSRFVEAVYEDN